MKIVKIILGALAGLVVILLVISLILVRGGFKHIDTVLYPVSESAYGSWEEILANPGPIKVWSVNTGRMHGDRYKGHEGAYEDRYEDTSALVYLVQHDRFGDMLVDTGFDDSFSKNPPFGNYPMVVKIVLTLMGEDDISQDEGADLGSRLRNFGFKPIKAFFTHLHLDHTAGVPVLDKETELVFDKRELSFFSKMTIMLSHLKGFKQASIIDFSNGKPLGPFESAIDLLGDGSFWAVSTIGHTPGHTSYLVNGIDGAYFIAGDAVFYHNSLKYNLGKNYFDMNYDLARESRSKIIEFCKSYPEVSIFYGHEDTEAH